jgi:two-component system, cell cycle sensor histidine kinase and response regulator CckA
LRHSMKEQIETRIAKLIEAVKKASPKDSSGRPLTGGALERLVNAIEVVLLLVNALEENTSDRIYFKDLQGRFIYVSKSYSMTFRDPGEAIGKTDFDVFAAERAQAAFEDEQQIIRTGEPIVNKVEKETWRNGSATWALTTKIPVRDTRGALVGTFGISRDITRLKRTQDALEKSEERYRILFNHINDAAFVHGITPDGLPGRYTEVNDVACERTGYTREELLRMSPLDFRSPEGEWKEVEQEMMARLRAEKHAAWESIHVSKAGLKIPVEIRSRLFEVAGEPTVLTIARDLSGLKQLEENLEREKSLLLTLINNLPDYVSVKDTESRVLIANTANARVMGLEAPEDAIGKTDLDFFPREEAARYLADEQTVMQTGTPLINKEEVSFDRDGHKRWTLTTKVPLKNSLGKVIGVVCTGRDITERKEAEERIHDLARLSEENPNPVMRVSSDGSILYQNQSSRSLLSSKGLSVGSRIPSEYVPELLQASATGEIRQIEASNGKKVFDFTIAPVSARGYINLYGRDVTEEKSLAAKFLQAQKMEAVGRLAGGIAHDFNNLLTVISGYCELAQTELAESSLVRGHIDEIAKAAKHAATLTAKLLAFSRKQVLVPRVINLNTLLRTYENIFARLVGEDIEVRTILSAEAGNIKTDPGQIEQVLMNLVVNARDAMPGGGKLTIETSNRTLDNEYASEHPGVRTGEYVQIAVSDTGHGMGKEVLSHLFEPFFTTKEQGKGTGLGLSTVYGIVKQSAGHITCYSEPGKGTTFTIHFPRTAEAGDGTADALAGTAVFRGTETILLVEDEDMIRRYTRTVLENSGYTVISASGGSEALTAIELHKCKVALLVTDVVMPKMSGTELAQKVLLTCPRVKVLFVSGYTGEAIAHKGLLDPVTNFIQKPFSSIEFLKKIREILDRLENP